MIDKHEVQGMLELIFTNIFKNKLLWSVTSTRVVFDSFAGTGFTLQNRTTAGYLPHFPLPRKEKMLKQIHQFCHDRCQPY